MSLFSRGEKYRLYQGDCLEVLRDLPEGTARFVFTDPPYNLRPYSKEIPMEGRENLSKTAEWDEHFDPQDLVVPLQRVLTPDGNVFAFSSYNVFGRWHEVFDPLYDTFQYMVWKKSNPTMQLRRTSFLNAVELIVCFWNRGHVWNFTSQNEMHNFIETPICMGKERIRDPDTGKVLHPTQKPLAALRRQILWCTNPGDVILDPYGGVFSIGHAAVELGRRYLGVEKNGKYFEAGRRRMERVAAQPTVEQCLEDPWS